ncbi:MAG: hypothetical protein Q7Q71_05510 [Verrucomicrobiota bacterium JB023]|nr:hypothetical protein [Verrucomicrobiota bacterium JB023]
MPPAKKIDDWGRRLRTYLSPASHRSYETLRSKGLNLPDAKTPCAVFDFTSHAIDGVGGRYLFYLVHEAIAAGFHPLFRDRYRFLATFPHKRFKRLLLELPHGVCHGDEDLPAGSILVTDHARSADRFTSIGKTILIDYEQRRPVRPDEYALPFSSHPSIIHQGHDLSDFRKGHPRKQRVFFAGEAKRPKYAKPELESVYGVLNRADAIEMIELALQEESLDPAKIRLCYRAQDRVAKSEWLPTLGDSDFFLALPGVGMPLCHNLIESLSLGTIPILQYPQYLDPPLQHGENCLVFENEDDLLLIVASAIRMPTEEIARLSKAAVDYYEEHLAPGRFFRRLMSRPGENPTVFVNAYRVPRPPVSSENSF